MALMLDEELDENVTTIKVIGVGGGGGNAVNRMVSDGLQGVEFIAMNTDQQALAKNHASVKVQLGSKLTKGRGAGADPEIGQRAAEETKDEIANALKGSQMVFITAGMGGGTGTGAAPVVAEVAHDLGILTVGIVTKPFSFEGKRKMGLAEQGIANLLMHVDSLIVIPNERLKMISQEKITLMNAFQAADNVLRQGVESISALINVPAFINLDFADVRSIMKDAGYAHMGVGSAKGAGKAENAAKAAISSPLLETSIAGAHGVIINITSSPDIGLEDVETAAGLITQSAHPDANIICGAGIDESMGDKVRITVIATGFEKTPFPPREPVKSARDINRDRLYGSNYGATGATGATGSYTPGNYGATGVYTPSYTSSDSYNSHPTMGVPQAPMTQQPAQPAYYAPQQPAQPQQPAYGQPQLFGNQPQQLDYAQQGYTGNMQPVQQQYAGGATGPMPSVQPQQPKRPTTDANGVPSFMKRRGN